MSDYTGQKTTHYGKESTQSYEPRINQEMMVTSCGAQGGAIARILQITPLLPGYSSVAKHGINIQITSSLLLLLSLIG